MILAYDLTRVPQLDRARIRNRRALAGLSIEQCVKHSCLKEFWRLIESGYRIAVDYETIREIANQLACDPHEIVYPPIATLAWPQVINVFDSEDRSEAPQAKSCVKIMIEADPEGRSSQLTVNFRGVSRNETEKFWDMLTRGVTA